MSYQRGQKRERDESEDENTDTSIPKKRQKQSLRNNNTQLRRRSRRLLSRNNNTHYYENSVEPDNTSSINNNRHTHTPQYNTERNRHMVIDSSDDGETESKIDMNANNAKNTNNSNNVQERTERKRFEYTSEQKTKFKKQFEILKLELEIKEGDDITKIHANQEQCSKQICDKLMGDRKIINVMVLARTQSGKTGTMIALIKNYMKTTYIPLKNVYVITGLSSKLWVKQTCERFPETMEKRIHHRNKLNDKFIREIKQKENVLIIIDESHIASQQDQTSYKIFKKCGFYNLQNLLKKDIKIVEFTATPDGTIYDLKKWGPNAHIIKMVPGNDYVSAYDLLERGRVFQCKDLCTNRFAIKNIGVIKEKITKTFDNKRYHLIRRQSGKNSAKTIQNFKTVFGNDCKYKTFDQQSKCDISDDINDILKKKPNKHTFIFIKEKLRCAKTIEKQYIGVMYERYPGNNPSDSVIIQGLIGRATGYTDNGDTIIFTHKESIERYEKLWACNFQNKRLPWNSMTTVYTKKKKIVKTKKTFNNVGFIEGHKHHDQTVNDVDDNIIVKKFKTPKKMKEYCKTTLKKYGPSEKTLKKLEMNENGFYLNWFKIQRKKKVWSYEDVIAHKRTGLGSRTIWRLHVCYENINDKTTLLYCIAHKPV
eukprot:359036_1